ncbi:syncoilin isoform X1 [Nothobranchius furzeri]|uniref:Transcript variant X1 n=2 Tax=Nothobranchius furzeri TaxID=105023 RepID=A0A8C6PUJ7_NOTFU|nr:transcript variant X1 [Nothobranchius furzeri]
MVVTLFLLKLVMGSKRPAEEHKHLTSTEESRVEEMSKNILTGSEAETAVVLHECTQHNTPEVGMDELGLLFDSRINEVSRLERQRDEMIQELLELQEPMLQVVELLRGKLSDARRLLTLAQLDYNAVHEDVQQVKVKLFLTTRDSIQSQVTLDACKYEVAQSRITQEELNGHLQHLSQELSQLQVAHQNLLISLRDRARRPWRSRAMSDVSQCRQASVRLQRRLSGSVRALEGWYEPRLMALLKRRQVAEEALRNSREQATDLRARLGPLIGEIERLGVQRSCLEKKIMLMETEREEKAALHKETVENLQTSLRKLQLEFNVQKMYKKDLEMLINGLETDLTFLRGRNEPRTTAEEGQFPIIIPNQTTSRTDSCVQSNL